MDKPIKHMPEKWRFKLYTVRADIEVDVKYTTAKIKKCVEDALKSLEEKDILTVSLIRVDYTGTKEDVIN